MSSEVKTDKLSQRGSSGIVITDDIKLSSGKAIKQADGTDLLTEAGAYGDVKLASGKAIKNASGTALLGEDRALGSGVTGAGAWIKLASCDCDGETAATFDNTKITSAYQNYVIIGRGIIPVSNGPQLIIRLSYDNGTNFNSIEGARRYYQMGASAGGSTTGGTSTTNIYTSDNSQNAVARGMYCDFHFYGLQTANMDKQVQFTTGGLHGTGYWYNGGAMVLKDDASSVINHLTVKFDSGSILAGYFTLYGIAE